MGPTQTGDYGYPVIRLFRLTEVPVTKEIASKEGLWSIIYVQPISIRSSQFQGKLPSDKISFRASRSTTPGLTLLGGLSVFFTKPGTGPF